MIVVVSVVMVVANDNAIPCHVVFAPIVIPASSITVPINVVFAANVVACVGVQKISHAEAPLITETVAPTVEVSAPAVLKIYVPFPLSTSGHPTSIAHTLQ